MVQELAVLGNVIPCLSLEGPEQETDARRGVGVYRKVMQTMTDLRHLGVPFGFSCMITRKNLDAVISDEFNDALLDRGVLFGWHFMYMPLGCHPDLSLMPTPEQRDRLRVQGARRIRRTKPLFVIDFWNDAPYVGGCIAAGRGYFHINSSGDVEPCIFTHFAVDNVRGRGLRQVLNSPYFRGIRQLQPYSENLLRPCMLIDNPSIFRFIHDKYKPYPTHPTAPLLLDELKPGLDLYSDALAHVLDPAWCEDKATHGFQTHSEIPIAAAFGDGHR